MARHGISAKMIVNGKYKGFGDISVDMSGNEIEVSSRGENYKRYLRGQKSFKIDSSASIGSEGASAVLAAYHSGASVPVTLVGSSQQFDDENYGSGGTVVSANMVVLSVSPSYPKDGEATIDFTLGLDARETASPTINTSNL